MTELQRREELQSEVRGAQLALVALLQERLETATQLKAARAELEQLTSGIEHARAEHTRQIAEFDGLVRGAIAQGKTLAAEIEELVRRRDAEIEHVALSTTPPLTVPSVALSAPSPPTVPSIAPSATPSPTSVALSATPPPAVPSVAVSATPPPTVLSVALGATPPPTAEFAQQTPAPSRTAAPEPDVAVVPSPMARLSAFPTASIGLRAMLAGRPPQLVTSAAHRAPRLVAHTAPIAQPARAPIARSIREQLMALREELPASHVAGVFRRLHLHTPSLRQVANLVIGCILVLLAILLTPVSQVAGGLQLLAVMSGSMEPTIQVGGIVGIRPVPVTDLVVGNVITFATQANPDVLVTHRIVSLETRDGQTMVTTKGDANNSVDAMAAAADHAVGRVDFSLPWLGYLMVWLASPIAKILIVLATVASFALPSVKRPAAPAAARREDVSGDPPATSYTALEDEIQALLTPQP